MPFGMIFIIDLVYGAVEPSHQLSTTRSHHLGWFWYRIHYMHYLELFAFYCLVMPLPRSVFNPALYARIWDIWFEGLPSNASVAPDSIVKARWFPQDQQQREKFDQVCRQGLEEPLASIAPSKGVPIDTLKHDIETEVIVNIPSTVRHSSYLQSVELQRSKGTIRYCSCSIITPRPDTAKSASKSRFLVLGLQLLWCPLPASIT